MAAKAGAARCLRCGTELAQAVSELVLTGASPQLSGQRWVVTGDVAVIGRAPTAEVRIDDRSVSRAHARIVRENGGFFIEDAGGQNGTFVNGERIAARTPIAEGVRIEVGQLELTATLVGKPKGVTTAAPVFMATTVVTVGDALGADLTERETGTVSVAILPEADAPSIGVDEMQLAAVTAEEEHAADVLSAELVTEARGAAPGYGLDALTVAVDDFARSFDDIHTALLRFRERYTSLGGADAAIGIATHAAVVADDPEKLATLLAFGQQAQRVRQLAEAVIDLGMTLEPRTGDPSNEG